MKPVARMSVGELAAYISTHLREAGIDVVLSGGTCVSIYSAGKYVSKDCVKDRLAAYYHWGDRQSLQQAILVVRGNEVDLKDVKRWSKREGRAAEFDEIAGDLSG